MWECDCSEGNLKWGGELLWNRFLNPEIIVSVVGQEFFLQGEIFFSSS